MCLFLVSHSTRATVGLSQSSPSDQSDAVDFGNAACAQMGVMEGTNHSPAPAKKHVVLAAASETTTGALPTASAVSLLFLSSAAAAGRQAGSRRETEGGKELIESMGVVVIEICR